MNLLQLFQGCIHMDLMNEVLVVGVRHPTGLNAYVLAPYLGPFVPT